MAPVFLLAVGILFPVTSLAADQCVASHTDPGNRQALNQPFTEIG